MIMEKPKIETRSDIYSLHRYIDGNGVPDYDKIFSRGQSKLWIRRHLDPGLLRILENQPDIIRNDRFINLHLVQCPECRGAKFGSDPKEKQGDLPY